MFNETRITADDAESLLKIEENHYNDFKAKYSLPKIMKTASAFANADGGDLFIAIGDKSEPDRLSGLYPDIEDANACIHALYGCFNDGQEYLSSEFLNINGHGYCLHVTVQKTPFIVKTADGKIYKRQNASDREIKNQNDISLLELEKGVRSFEDRPVEATADEIQGSAPLNRFLKHVIPFADVDTFLKKERLLSDNKLRMCALLLFDDNPQSLAPHSAVKIYRYKTLADEGNREDLEGQPETIEGPIYDIIFAAVNRTKEIVESIPFLSDAGLIAVKYPEEAIHEIICNAVLHRDYSINDYVHVRIFDNRIEVESPGKLAGPVTVRNILKQRFARNKKMVRLIAKFPSPPNKDVGEGLNTAFKSMQKLNLGKPKISETEASVLVRLKHEPLASKEEIISTYLSKYSTINNTKARDICNLESDSIIRKTFKKMILAGEIEKVPESRGKGTMYRLKE